MSSLVEERSRLRDDVDTSFNAQQKLVEQTRCTMLGPGVVHDGIDEGDRAAHDEGDRAGYGVHRCSLT